MTCVSRWWITAWVLGPAPWGLIRRGHCMSGKQGEILRICWQLPCLCLIYVLWVWQGGEEVWGTALNWTEKFISLTSTASLMWKLDKALLLNPIVSSHSQRASYFSSDLVLWDEDFLPVVSSLDSCDGYCGVVTHCISVWGLAQIGTDCSHKEHFFPKTLF